MDTRRLPLLVAAPILAALALTGCGSHGSDTSPSAAAGSVAQGNAPVQSESLASDGNAKDASGSHGYAASQPARQEVQKAAVISTGDIDLTSSDLVATRDRLDTVLAREGGHVADEQTVTDDHGVVTRSHLVLRVPSARFDRAMTALGGIASLRSASRQAEDVTTKVIDLEARIRAEQAGVRRLRALVSHTASLGALLNVESALTQRQGQLESLQGQRAYLADQTSLATITVDITRKAPNTALRPAGESRSRNTSNE